MDTKMIKKYFHEEWAKEEEALKISLETLGALSGRGLETTWNHQDNSNTGHRACVGGANFLAMP